MDDNFFTNTGDNNFSPREIYDATSAGFLVDNPWLIILIYAAFAVVLIFVALVIIRRFLHSRGGSSENFRKIILSITLPKESLKQEKGKEKETQQSIAEEIDC